MKYIYKITNDLTKECYIGQTNNLNRRWKEHQTNASNKQYPLYRAMRYWGLDIFSIVVLETCEDNQADEREQYWITKYNSVEKGYNQVNVNETKRSRFKKRMKGVLNENKQSNS